jgi:hypothetical protein
VLPSMFILFDLTFSLVPVFLTFGDQDFFFFFVLESNDL